MSKTINKLDNNRASKPDKIIAEPTKHAIEVVHVFIQELLNNVLENHQSLGLGSSIHVALQKPDKPKGPVINLRPLNLLVMIRKILSNILLAQIKPAYEKYLSSISKCMSV